jgi:hypothetical protein
MAVASIGRLKITCNNHPDSSSRSRDQQKSSFKSCNYKPNKHVITRDEKGNTLG